MQRYSPAPSPTNNGQVLPYLVRELQKISLALQGLMEVVTARSSAPLHYEIGDLFLADGVNWDPLSLAGSAPYWVYWNGSAFVALA